MINNQANRRPFFTHRNGTLLRGHPGHDRFRSGHLLARVLEVPGPSVPAVHHHLRPGWVRATQLRGLHLSTVGQRARVVHRRFVDDHDPADGLLQADRHAGNLPTGETLIYLVGLCNLCGCFAANDLPDDSLARSADGRQRRYDGTGSGSVDQRGRRRRGLSAIILAQVRHLFRLIAWHVMPGTQGERSFVLLGYVNQFGRRAKFVWATSRSVLGLYENFLIASSR